MALVIVESFAKIPKLKTLLPSNYEILASGGHIMDLDPSNMSLDLTNFEPTYKYYPKSKDIINKIKKAYVNKKKLIIASDLDREGEFIALSLIKLLNIKNNYERIVFKEITKKAITYAINNPVKIDDNKVKAQQTRRFMDRIFGYSLSPLLSRIPELEYSKQLGCGRVQSAFVKIIIERENEIQKFMNSDQCLTYEGFGEFIIDNINIKTYLVNSQNKRMICNVNSFNLDMLLYKVSFSPLSTWKISSIKNKILNKSPKSPYSTSLLQSDASSKLHWSVKKIMQVAQQLYEKGLITYMRTDSVTLSDDALSMCEKYIIHTYGEEYYTKTEYETNIASAQEGHEAIRPCDINVKLTSSTSNFNNDMYKLYDLIWKRTIASQMSKSIIETMQITLLPTLFGSLEPYGMIGSKSRYIFKGYTIVWTDLDLGLENENVEMENEENNININSDVQFVSMTVSENIKSPPSRYTESQLVKAVTKAGIGRPGTTASFISKIQERNYVKIQDIEGVPKTLLKFSSSNINIKKGIIVEKFTMNVGCEKKRMVPTKIGITVNDFLEEHFPLFMDITFTAKLEEYLSNICIGKEDWKKVLHNFYEILKPQIEIVLNKFNIRPRKNPSNEIIGMFNKEEIVYIQTRHGYAIKTIVSNKDIWVNVSEKPDEETARKLISDKINKPISTIIKTFGKTFAIRKSIKGVFLQVTKGKKVKFLPIKHINPDIITKQQCEQLAKTFLKL